MEIDWEYEKAEEKYARERKGQPRRVREMVPDPIHWLNL